MRHVAIDSSARPRRAMMAVALVASLFCFSSLHAETVARIDISGLKTLTEEEVRSVIPIKKGDAFSLEKVDMAIRFLRKWGAFDSIEASPQVTPEGVVINFHLDQATIIQVINIGGNYPFLENKIRKYLSIHAGDIYTPDMLDEQIKRITDFYKRQGFVGTEVYVDEKERPEVGGVALTFHIRRGGVLRYRRIEINGNKAFPDGRFVSAINTLKPFSERRLSDALRNLREFYKKMGYPRARVKLREKHIDLEKNRVDIVIDVFEGPHVLIAFAGSPHTDRRMLRRAVTVLRNGSIDAFEIERSADAIRELMQDRGYPNARVGWRRELLPDGTILVTFDIREGTPSRIRHLRFKTVYRVKKKKILQQMHNRQMAVGQRGTYFKEYVETDTETIRRIMSQHGFRDPKIGEWKIERTPQGYALDISIPVEEGKQTLVGSVNFRGNTSFEERRLLRGLKNTKGEPFDEEGLAEDSRMLSAHYADNGHPYAEVNHGWSINESGEADIVYDIKEGPEVIIGQILIVGDVLTSQKAIRKTMSIREGDPFSYRKIVESQLNIRRLGAFTAVNIETIGLEDRQDVIHLRVKVEEERPFKLDLDVSYSTDEQYTGSLIFSNLNSFGWAKTNILKLTAGKDLSRAEIGWVDPRFMGSSFEMSDFAWVQYKHKPAYTYTQVGGSLGWFRRFRRFGFLFRYELDRNYFIEGDSVAADADSLRNNTISKISLSASYDSRNSFSYPTKGFFTLGGANIFNEIKGNQANFVHFNWRGENDLTFWKYFTVSTAGRFDRIHTISNNISVPTNELIFLGGDDTIRGFSEDSLGPVDANGNATGGRTRWVFNEELRIRLFASLSWALFYDMGSLTNDFTQISRGTVRHSAGLGLRYTTPVGPIRADYGFKLDRRAGESRGRFHFTFGYVF